MLTKIIKEKIIKINNLMKNYIYMSKSKADLENIKLDIEQIIKDLEYYSNQKIVELVKTHYDDLAKNTNDRQLTVKIVQDIDQFYQQCLKNKLNFLIYLSKVTKRIKNLQLQPFEHCINQQLQHYDIIKNYIINREHKKLEHFLNENIIDFNLQLTNDDDCYWNLLIIACHKGNLNIVKMLVNNNANIEYVNDNNLNPLLAALDSYNINIAEYLLEMGANPDVIDNEAISALIKSNIEPKLFENLITKYNANLELPISYGTILHYACEFFDIDSILFLLDNGANIHALDSENNSALHILINQRNSDNIIENIKIMKILIKRGINIDEQNINGSTALHCAIEQEVFEYIKILLDDDASTCIKDSSGRTAEQMLNSDDLWIDLFGLIHINNDSDF